VSLKDQDRIYFTPRGAGGVYRWDITEKQIVVTDLMANNVSGGTANITSEAGTHYAIYRDFPDMTCVIHCHAVYMMAFGAAHMDIPTVINECAKNNLGEMPVQRTKEVKPGSEEQSQEVLRLFHQRREAYPDAVLIANIPFHGIFIAGTDIMKTFATLQAAEDAARVALYRGLLLADGNSNGFLLHGTKASNAATGGRQ
jgi:L-ribulose-5-phosphate 4-epimerase